MASSKVFADDLQTIAAEYVHKFRDSAAQEEFSKHLDRILDEVAKGDEPRGDKELWRQIDLRNSLILYAYARRKPNLQLNTKVLNALAESIKKNNAIFFGRELSLVGDIMYRSDRPNQFRAYLEAVGSASRFFPPSEYHWEEFIEQGITKRLADTDRLQKAGFKPGEVETISSTLIEAVGRMTESTMGCGGMATRIKWVLRSSLLRR